MIYDEPGEIAELVEFYPACRALLSQRAGRIPKLLARFWHMLLRCWLMLLCCLLAGWTWGSNKLVGLGDSVWIGGAAILRYVVTTGEMPMSLA